jgi:translation initiation factor 3 subunit B
MFMELESVEDAIEAVKKGDNYRLDKSHVLAVNRFSDFDKFMATPEEYTPPVKEEYVAKPDLSFYLTDELGRDQFAVLAGDETLVYWNNCKGVEPTAIEARSKWTESYLQWSPFGSYLASFHPMGVALWGGPKWERIERFTHQGVKLIDFSPQENYLVTWSPEATKNGENLRVWDIRSGKLLRGFSTPQGKKMEWPVFKWSKDDRMVARAGNDAIAVYELPAFTLLDGKPVKADGLKEFSWSPAGNLIAYWTPEAGNTPARVTVVDLISKSVVRTKNFFLVADVS